MIRRVFRRYWPAFSIAFVLVFFVCVLPIWTSDDFAYCEDHNGQYPSTNSVKNEPPAIRAIHSHPSWIFGSCLSGFVSNDGVGITAVFTVFLTFATGILAWFAIIQTINGQRQLRAYVFPEAGNLFDGMTIQPPQPQNANKPSAILQFKNTGQTPAKDMTSWMYMDVIEPRHENTLVIPPFQKIYARSLGAGAMSPKTYIFPRVLNAQELIDIGSGAKRIYVYGRIEYVDIFREPHFTNFRFWYQGIYPLATGMFFNTSEHGNEFD